MIKFIFLGLVQGITEFFPVSSSGHLVIFQTILGIHQDVVFLDVVLHLGTLCSLIIFFRQDIFILFYNFFTAIFDIVFRRKMFYVWQYNEKFKLCIYIAITTVITGLIAVVGKEFFEKQFESVNTVALSLFVTSVIIFLTKNFSSGQRLLEHISLKDSVLLGLAQALAIIPGISRAGITISLLLFRNIDRESAFRLSFLASIPAVLGAFVLKFKETQGVTREIPFLYLLSGFLAAFIIGLIVLYILRSILKRRGFYKFSYYCFFLSMLILLLRLFHIL